jgi:hypothetical protein
VRHDNSTAAPWERITPDELLPAVKHIRKSFDQSSWICSQLTEKPCYSALHPQVVDADALTQYNAKFTDYRTMLPRATQQELNELLAMGTPPAFFLAYLDAFCKGLEVEVRRLFNEVLQIGLANSEALKMHPVEWAKAHLGMLVAANSYPVVSWIKSVCDDRGTWKPTDTGNNSEDDSLCWKTWRAPKLVHMQPSGTTPYNPANAWTREDESETETLLEYLFKSRFAMSLQVALNTIGGDAYVGCAKRANTKQPTLDAHRVPQTPPPATELGGSRSSVAKYSAQGSPPTKPPSAKSGGQEQDRPALLMDKSFIFPFAPNASEEQIVQMEQYSLAQIGESRGVFAAYNGSPAQYDRLWVEHGLPPLYAWIRSRLRDSHSPSLDAARIHFLVVPSKEYLTDPERDIALRWVEKTKRLKGLNEKILFNATETDDQSHAPAAGADAAEAEQRGPKPDSDRHRGIAEVVKQYGADWKEFSNLEKIARELKKRKIAPAKSWEKRDRPARSWIRALEYYPDLVRKALAYSLKMAAKDTAEKPSQTLANSR